MRDLSEQDTDLGEMIDADEFIGMVVDGEIADEDGYFNWIYEDNKLDEKEREPSEVMTIEIPEDVTHVLWFQV